jgi:hypothetical protein
MSRRSMQCMTIIGAVLGSLVLSTTGCAPRSGTHSEGISAVGLTPSQWAALSKPGTSHSLLAPFVGEWNVRLTFWSGPQSKASVSNGTSTISWILGKRFVQERFQGKAGGEAFDGMGLMGYDNGSRSFKTIWLDSLNTAMTMASGRYVPESNTFELTSDVYDPLVSGEKTVRSTLQFTSNDAYVFTMIDRSPEGKEFVSLTMEYSRKG